ncbi:MAG: hydroxymethylbilane synthase, partial [Planctomycetota bacterium]
MIRIGTRGSELALWQARKIAARIRELTGESPELSVITTRGDRIEDVPLTAELGRSFFTKEIEEALLRDRIDLAVHSLKDLAVEQPRGLCLAAVVERISSRERLLMRPEAVDREAEGDSGLPLGPRAVVGTSSPRRRRRLLELRPDLRIKELRGNVPTRVKKLEDGHYDAVLLACAGLERLGIRPAGLASVDLPEWLFPGAPGQGALGIQCRANDAELRGLLARIDDPTTALLTRSERSLLAQLGGGCNLPLGCHCALRPEGGYRLAAFLFPASEEHASLSVHLSGEDPEALATEAARTLGLAL